MDSHFLNSAFPFHFAVDPALQVTAVGPSLVKLAPKFTPGAAMGDLISLTTEVKGWKDAKKSDNTMSTQAKPITGTVAAAGNYARLYARQGLPFDLRLIEQEIPLNGQWAATSCGLAFLSSPVIKTHYDLSRFGISASDFPAHARAMEMIEATEKLAAATSKQNQTASAEQTLSYELTVAADLMIRFSRYGKVVDSHAADPAYMPNTEVAPGGNTLFEDFPEIAAQVKDAIEKLEQSELPVSLVFELQREAKKFYFEARVAKSLRDHYVLVGRDLTEHRRLEQRLTYIAHHDPLTRLANRGFFERCVQNALQKAIPCAVMFIDMNDFKAINDCHGHGIGDEVLKAIANRLNGICGLEDISGRLGGDEFGLIIKNVTDGGKAVEAAERVVAAIQEPLQLEGLSIKPRASVGVTIPVPGNTTEMVFRHSDVAMYEAKREDSEKDYALFSPEMLEGYLNGVRLKRDFGQAISAHELEVHFQPIKSMLTEDWYGFEALVRWQHPTRGLLAPEEFIALAEESGDILTIGEQVLRMACTDARRVTQSGRELMLCVNVSQIQLQDERLVEMISGVLSDTGWSPRRLTIEVPESALSADGHSAVDLLNGIRGLGVRIAVDDFGMGQSSLRYLEELPIDMIKLDRELMARLDGSESGGSRLIESVIRLGHTFGFDVVAEGVERTVQESIVKSFGCRYAQGYLYAKPIPVEHLAGLPGLEVSLGPSTRKPASVGPAASPLAPTVTPATQSPAPLNALPPLPPTTLPPTPLKALPPLPPPVEEPLPSYIVR